MKSGVFLSTCLICASAVILYFTSSYFFHGHSGLPIGWDTPRYVGQMFWIQKHGVIPFIQHNEYYNFGYGLFLSTLVTAGLSPFAIEIVFPIALCFFIMVMSGFFVIRFLRDKEIAVFTTLLASSWFALYRLGADLHPNLFALFLLLATSYSFLLTYERTSIRKRLAWVPILILASFIHIETTIFFSFILIVTALQLHKLTRANYSLRNMLIDFCLILFAIMPSVVLYIQHIRILASYSSGVLVSYPPLAINSWIESLGILSPIVILGLCLMLRNTFRGERANCSHNFFIISWAITSILIASAHYIFPGVQIFSERALILFPVPFVASVGLKAIINNAQDRVKVKSLRMPLSKSLDRRKVIGVATILVAFTSSLFFTYSQATIHSKVWISPSAYEKLRWLSGHYKLETWPIFILNDYDQYAGALGDLNNNWVQAIYGDHYSYLGDVSFLLALSETPFKSRASQSFSSIFLEKMVKDGVFSMPELLQHKIILVTDFYLPRPLPTYNKVLFDEIYSGIFVINHDGLTNGQNLYLPLYSRILSEASSLGWYSRQRNWAKSIHTLEFWNENPSTQSFSEFLISIAKPGNYSFVLRYWDGTGASDVSLEIDGNLLGKICYTGTLRPANFTVDFGFLSAGVSVFRVVLEYAWNQPQFASLDYLEISLNEPK